MNRTLLASAMLAAMISAPVLAGCTSAGSSSGASAGSAAGAAVPGGDVGAPAGGGAKLAPAHELAGSIPQAPTRAGGTVGGPSENTADVTSLALIGPASLDVRIAEASAVAHAADEADRIALASGGSVYSDDRTAGKHASASLTLKVPPESLASILNRLAALGKELQRSSSTKDVTSQVADVASRTLSARQSLARLRALYTEATKVGQVIEIESEIATREADLESLEAQQRALSSQTATATINLSLTAAKHVAPPPKPRHAGGAFLGGLTHGWDAFVTALTALVTALGAVLPFLVVLLIAGALAWRIRRRVRGSRAPEPSPTP